MSVARRIVIVLALVVVFGNGLTQRGSTAYLTNSQTNTGNAFNAGNVTLGSSPTSAYFTVSGLYPGQSTSAVNVTLTNSGNLDVQYTMSTAVASGNSTLASTVTLSVIQGTCGGGGASLYSGSLSAASLALRPTTPIAPSGTDQLCFQATLPSSAASSLQGQTVNVTFTFQSQQAVQV